MKNVTTVHDLAYELGYVGSGVRGALHRLEHRRAFYASDALICVSARTRHDLFNVYPSLAGRCEVFVIPHGVSLPSVPYQSQPVAMAPTASPYLLFVGGRGAYKNFSAALEAFAISGLAQDGYSLLCTGSPFSNAEAKQIARWRLERSIRAVGAIDRLQLARLYANAYCLLYPSLFEGFGMPLLEAMRLGCPVVASNTSVMPEVAGDAALLVEGRDPHAIAAALLSLLDQTLKGQLVARGRARAALFTWERSAARHADVYLSLA